MTLHMDQDGRLYCRLPNGKYMYVLLTETPPPPVQLEATTRDTGTPHYYYRLVPPRL